MKQQERFEFIEAEIDRAFVHADDEWNKSITRTPQNTLLNTRLSKAERFARFVGHKGWPIRTTTTFGVQ